MNIIVLGAHPQEVERFGMSPKCLFYGYMNKSIKAELISESVCTKWAGCASYRTIN